MQSFLELSTSLGCTECESSFTSASLLLKHFAEHISRSTHKDDDEHDDVTLEKEVELEKQSWKKEKNESILEKALRSPLATATKAGKLSSSRPQPTGKHMNTSFVKESSTSSSRKISVFSAPKTLGSNAILPNSCAKTPSKNVLVEVPKRPKSKCSTLGNVMFVKLDLQKRLENCVLKLVRRDSSVTHDSQSALMNSLKNNPNLSCLTKVSEGPNMINGAPTMQRENDANELLENSEPQDEFNPLKFCVVTLEEGDEKLELNDEESGESCSPTPIDDLTSYSVVPEKARKPMKCRNENTKALAKLKRTLIGSGNGVVKPESSRKKYPCNYCSKQFGWSTDLKRHILTHTGERPFKCTLCSATFTRNFLLQKHIGKVHSGRLPTSKSAIQTSEEIALSRKVLTNTFDQVLSDAKETKVLNGDRSGEEAVFGDSRTLSSGENGADYDGLNYKIQSGKGLIVSEFVNSQKEGMKSKPEQSHKKRKMTHEGLEEDEQRKKKKRKKKVANLIRNPLGTLVPGSTYPLHTLEGLNSKDSV